MKYFILLSSFLLCSYLILTKTIQNKKASDNYLKTINNNINSEYNQDIVFYIDFSIPSTDYRFFVIRLKDSMIINKGLCCNGRTTVNKEVVFSNVPGSKYSSKGAYKIGASYKGKFGKSFRLHGMNDTNSNAYIRNVVLHSYSGIPRTTTLFPICQSEGCTTVNPDFLKELSYYIERSNKPILLYVQ